MSTKQTQKRKLLQETSDSTKTRRIIDPREQIPYKKTNLSNNVFKFFPNLQVEEYINTGNDNDAIEIILNMAPRNIKNLLGFTGDDEMRKYIESLSADDQCRAAGIPFTKTGISCWLCGCEIKDDGIEKACEHIIPALRAVMFKGLYSNKIITNRVNENIEPTLKEEYETIMKNNYLWAHANCNLAKSNILLIEYDEKEKIFIPDETKSKELSISILNLHKTNPPSKNRDCYKQSGALYKEEPVKSPKDVFIIELTEQCKSINKELLMFEGNITKFSNYCLNKVKLYLTAKGIEALISQENREKDKNIKLKEEYEKLIKLLDEETKLSKNYINNIISILDPYTATDEQKIEYYTKLIELYLNYFNLDPTLNYGISETIINTLKNTTFGKELVSKIPLELMITIIYIFTQLVLFNRTDDGYKKLLNIRKQIDTTEKLSILKLLSTTRSKKDISRDIIKVLFINKDGTANKTGFNNHVCEYLSLFINQYIIYKLKVKGNLVSYKKQKKSSISIPNILSLSQISSSEISDLNNKLKSKLKDNIPDYKKKILDNEIFNKNGIWSKISDLFFTINEFEIKNCKDTVYKSIIDRLENTEIIKEDIDEKIKFVDNMNDDNNDTQNLNLLKTMLINKINRGKISMNNSESFTKYLNEKGLTDEKINSIQSLREIENISTELNKRFKYFGGKNQKKKRYNITKKIKKIKKNK